MSTQADIPSDLSDDGKAIVFQILDAWLNSMILYALLHGMYTGILAVTLWDIFINKFIILLHGLTTINFAANWSYVHSTFIENGKNFWTAYFAFAYGGQAMAVVQSIAFSMSTIITDLYIIWCCWMVWGQCWITVLLPILFLIAAIVLKIIITYYTYRNISKVTLISLYIALVLATTLWCTILIIFHILTVTGVKHNAALYSISLTIYLILTIYSDFGLYYLEFIATIARGVAPTLLIGRAAAGHTQPNDDDDSGTTVSSLHFQTASSEAGMTSYEESTIESAVHEIDIEAQQEQLDGLVEVVERTE
ncbi:hypothetical protein IW262DRAFT_1461021 [Armillaria fumosa]|nr:hypothetical protein IW262DRAFT_1461021 [Armillaria fumosa]